MPQHIRYRTGQSIFQQEMINPVDKKLFPNEKLRRSIQQALEKEQGDKLEIPLLSTRNKFGVASKEDRTYSDGFVFASKNEMERWDYLLKLQMAKEITDLQRQVSFELLEEFEHKQYGNVHPIVYVADFVYINTSFRTVPSGCIVVEDSKTGVRTPEYKLKRKLFLKKYPQYFFYEV